MKQISNILNYIKTGKFEPEKFCFIDYTVDNQTDEIIINWVGYSNDLKQHQFASFMKGTSRKATENELNKAFAEFMKTHDLIPFSLELAYQIQKNPLKQNNKKQK